MRSCCSVRRKAPPLSPAGPDRSRAKRCAAAGALRRELPPDVQDCERRGGEHHRLHPRHTRSRPVSGEPARARMKRRRRHTGQDLHTTDRERRRGWTWHSVDRLRFSMGRTMASSTLSSSRGTSEGPRPHFGALSRRAADNRNLELFHETETPGLRRHERIDTKSRPAPSVLGRV